MMNKRVAKMLVVCLVFVMFLSVFQVSNAYGQSYINVNGVSLAGLSSSQVDGKIKLVGETTRNKINILISKDSDQTWYDVELNNGKFEQEIWLTKGTGNYTVAIMVNEYGNEYSYGPTLYIENNKEQNKYLVPTKDVQSDNAEIIKLSKELTKDLKTDKEKAENIYNWVSKNIEYDYKKYLKHTEKNFDNKYGAVNTLTTKIGVCYDYSTLLAAIGRAAGIQVKVIKGQAVTGSFTGLHAWNEIYCSEEGRWIKVDSTFASTSGLDFFDSKDFDDTHKFTSEY